MTWLFCLLATTLACAPKRSSPARILAVGDSILAAHRGRGASIPDIVANRTGHVVTNVAQNGAWVTPGGGVTTVPEQRLDGSWDWLLLNGGANDLNGRCGCEACDAVMDELIAADTRSGALVDLVEQARTQGTRVLYVGYARFPEGARFGFDRCDEELVELGRRVAALAERVPGAWFVDVSSVTDEAYFVADRVHPSLEGSRVIGEQAARTVSQATR